MIGDREGGAGYEPAPPVVNYGPVDACVRLDPPTGLPPVWVERHGTLVVVRHVYGDGPDVTREVACPSAGHALVRHATEVGGLIGRGYQVMRL